MIMPNCVLCCDVLWPAVLCCAGGRTVRQWEAHDKRIWAVDFSPLDPQTFATGSDDGTVKVRGLIGVLWGGGRWEFGVTFDDDRCGCLTQLRLQLAATTGSST